MVGFVLVVVSSLLAPAVFADTAKEAYEAFVELAASPDSEEFAACFAAGVVDSIPSDEKDARLGELAEIMTTWAVDEVREEEDLAAVAVEKDKELREILLVAEDGQWKIQTAISYLVEGPSLAKRVGRRPAKLKLMARDGQDYGRSAFNFAYVTPKPEECKNRVDLWFCRSQELHAPSGRLLEIGKTSLKKIDRIPLSHEWGREVRANKGRSYVLHCLDRRDRDFYVELTVKKRTKSAVELEWSLLSEGTGAPPDLVGPHPLVSNDGADAIGPVCNKR